MRSLIYGSSWYYRLLRHVILVVSMISLFTWIAHSKAAVGTPVGRSLQMVSINALVFFGYGYLTVFFLIPRFLVQGKTVMFLLLFLSTGFLLSALKFLFSDYVFYTAISSGAEAAGRELTLKYLLVNTKDMTFIVALFALVKFARDRYRVEATIREMERRRVQAELKLLEHQMDPHVIFNNLNNLYSISINRPEILQASVKRLKKVLHYIFIDSKSSRVPLSREISMIENYIGLERLRYGHRVKIAYNVEGEVKDQRLAPLILYPFVENCFVHGAGEEAADGWISIVIRVEDASLSFHASNSVSTWKSRTSQASSDSAGETSIRRLELLYPNSHRLTIKDRPDEHHVELKLNF